MFSFFGMLPSHFFLSLMFVVRASPRPVFILPNRVGGPGIRRWGTHFDIASPFADGQPIGAQSPAGHSGLQLGSSEEEGDGPSVPHHGNKGLLPSG